MLARCAGCKNDLSTLGRGSARRRNRGDKAGMDAAAALSRRRSNGLENRDRREECETFAPLDSFQSFGRAAAALARKLHVARTPLPPGRSARLPNCPGMQDEVVSPRGAGLC